MAGLLRGLGEALPVVAVALSLGGGLTGLIIANRGPMRARTDRGAATSVALGLGLLVGAIAAVVTALIGAGFGGGSWLAVLPTAAVLFGLPAALVVVGAAALGYVAVAQLRPGANGAAGAVLGPVVLGAACLAAVALIGVANDMAEAAALQQDRAEMAEQSTGLHLTVDDVVASVDDKGLVTSVRVQLTIRSDAELAMELLPGKLVYPLFVLSPNGDDPTTQIQADSPGGSPAVLTAGSATHYDVLFDPVTTGTPILSGPGEWLLEIRIGGADGRRYGLEAAIPVAGS